VTRAGLVVGAALALSVSVQARAAASSVGLELRDCATLSESALREHLDLELATLALSKADARLLLRCDQTSVAIELYRASGASYPVQARVELRDTAKAARERLVALAASELVAQAERAGKTEAASSVVRSEPPPGPARANADRIERAPANGARPRIELYVAGNAAFNGEPKAALWGGSLGTRWGLTRTWSVLLDTRFERGQASVRLAEIRWTSLSGLVGAAASIEAGPLRLSAGLGVRAGWLSLAGTARLPSEGRSFTAPWAGLAVPTRLSFDVGGFLSPFVGAEVGYVVVPVRGNLDDAGNPDDGNTLLAQRGAWLSGSVGIAVAL
jgi:hypothetical protein